MSTKIFLLPDQVANQIAAGEVVQRPSSVLKELLENAVDAKSTAIKVVIKDGGSTLIQVIDNGNGMNEVDARMCFERHATSKIRTSEDLCSIQTLGFRGEALASIAAVSQITLISRATNQELGTHIILSNATFHKQTPTAAPIGTNISVKNLFFNMPARRNFLKSPTIENRHIIGELQRVALAYPKIAFDLYQNNTAIYSLPSHNLAQRIIHLFGKNYQTKLLPCQASTELIQLYGYIAPPKEAKKTRGGQFFFVNNRYIKSSYLHHAVKKAFDGLLAPNTFPFYIICIKLPPHHIDINVHPTKTEIKFQEESIVYGIIVTAIKKALATYHVTPSLDFEQATNYASLFPEKTLSKKEKDYSLFRTKSIQKKFVVDSSINLSKDEIKLIHQPTPILKDTTQPSNNNKLQLHKKYIIAPVKSGMLLIDQSAAHERIVYERILGQIKKFTIASQQLLLPLCIEFQPADLVLIQTCKKEIQALGFQFSIQSPNSIILTALPPEAKNLPPKQLFEELLEQYKCYSKKLSIPEVEKWVRSIAKHTRINEGSPLSSSEMEAVIEQLFTCQEPNYTPDGKLIWTILTLDQLGNLLGNKKEEKA